MIVGWHHCLCRLLHSKHNRWCYLHDGVFYVEYQDTNDEYMLCFNAHGSRTYCCNAVHI